MNPITKKNSNTLSTIWLYLIIILFAFLLGRLKQSNIILFDRISFILSWIITLIPFIYGSVKLLLQLLVNNWVKIECKILRSELTHVSLLGFYLYSPIIEYEFLFEGKTYRSSTIYRLHKPILIRKKAEELIQKYQRNEIYKCCVYQRNPDTSVLENKISYISFLLFTSLSILLLFIMEL
ncbi:MAG: hypothetical protein FD178_589 [Ignavibacteria bacterium]|nr:MAG: hypothetical protein FD178_589 [Ignavibacteria bacterium]